MDALVARILDDCRSSYAQEEYPCLYDQINKWSVERPFEGMCLLDATPIFTNTLIKYAALLAGGAQVHLAEPKVMPHDPDALALAKSYGLKLVDPEVISLPYDVVMDCAGYLSQVPSRLGYVELTKSGEEAYKACDLPVWMVDSGKIKQIETCLGTGESFFRAMDDLGHTSWGEGSLVVVGYGKVGRGIVLEALRRGIKVRIVDVASRDVPEACELILAEDSRSVKKAMDEAYAVVTATGIKHAMASLTSSVDFSSINALFANMGVEDEWGDGISEARVLNAKAPLNFILHDPTLMCFIDPPLALHNHGVLELMEAKSGQKGLWMPPQEVENYYLDIISSTQSVPQDLLKHLL